MLKPSMLVILLAAIPAAAMPAEIRHEGWPADQIGKETSIPLLRYRGLYSFKADGDRGVWLEDQRRRWYYATVLGPCTGLDFATRIGVDTRFNGDALDRTGTLLVDDEHCPISSLTASDGPPVKANKPKKG